MRTLQRLLPMTVVASALVVAACGSTSESPDSGANPDAGATSDGGATDAGSTFRAVEIAGDTTWSGEKTLEGHTFVMSGTLTIAPGTVIKGGKGTSLVITPNAKLNAVGTLANPIVFTSASAQPKPNDWGGVILLGSAPINFGIVNGSPAGGSGKIEGFADTEARVVYGGRGSPNATHDCGKLKYARIEFAGYELVKDKEINGLTLGGCGSTTEVDYVQVHKSGDDGVEVFGGTVNLKHILITQPDDDGLDWDFGWVGKAQFIIVQQSDRVGNAGFEADNHPSDFNVLPRSNPEIWNATLIGSDRDPGLAGKKQLAMVLRRGTAGRMSNLIVAHFTDFATDVDGAESKAQAEAGELTIKNSIFWDNANMTTSAWATETDNDQGFDESAFFSDATRANRFVDPQVQGALNLTAPSFSPATGSPAATGGATPPADGFFDTSATYLGAVGGASDWTAGWSLVP